MVEIPDQLKCLFSASVDQRGDSYSIEIPRDELEQETISRGDTYRVAVLPSTPQNGDITARQQDGSVPTSGAVERAPQTPPVEEGDVREVTIETIGDQGDGIAKIDRGYVVIVPEAETGDEMTIEIEQARENVAFAQVRTENTSGTHSDGNESLADEDDTLDERDELP